MDGADLLRRAAREQPGATAVDDGRRRLAMAELIERGERLANALEALGIGPGEPVGVLSENRAEYVEIDVGLVLGGQVRVALNARLTIDEFRHSAIDCGMRALLYSGRFESEAATLADELGLCAIGLDGAGDAQPRYDELLARAPAQARARQLEPGMPAWISYTSGTTGRPKGVVLSRGAICQVAVNLLLEPGRPAAGEQLVLPQPLSHGAGYFVLPYLLCGAGIHVMDRFDPERALALSRRPEVRTLKLVPAMLPPLIDACRDDCGFETIIYGAAPIAPAVLDASLERFGPVLFQLYGQSEAPMTITCLHKHEHGRGASHRLSVGRPWRTVDVEVVDPEGRPCAAGETGEVRVRGAHAMSGYNGLPEVTAEVMRDGWIHTRDMGAIDEAGYVHLMGRMDEMIISGGFNIAPREVERVLAEHEQIADCVVLGTPDERWGDAVTAVLVARPGSDLSPDVVVEFARPRLGFRAPKRVVLVEQLPRNAYGKVDRAAVLAVLDRHAEPTAPAAP